jgi:hypothetical protein
MNNVEGKTVASVSTKTKYETTLIINFTDGSTLTVELDNVNNSCHCHPEYEYFLTVSSYDSSTGETEVNEVR